MKAAPVAGAPAEAPVVEAPAVDAPAPGAAPRRFGDAMAEVGRRFERAGRAVIAGRWDLADYDLGELGEVFDDDLRHAARPEDVPSDPQPAIAEFAATALPRLQAAVRAHDRAGYDAAVAAAAQACNACHEASAKAFIVVPSATGAAVPELSPVADE
ncbi:MAG: hypothetical protein H6709_10395 [Kofleriaceae bacterium]|nr:hypothetical protein [Kofleriaceae bacterium]